MSAHFTVERIAPEPGKDRALSDQEVFDMLRFQMRRQMRGGTLKISVRASEAQVDKAMQELMLDRVARFEQECMKHGIPLP